MMPVSYTHLDVYKRQVLQDAGMVAFYEKNGYPQTHIEPEKEGMDMVYMKKLIEK